MPTTQLTLPSTTGAESDVTVSATLTAFAGSVVAGAAAVLAQARPELRGLDLRSLLVGTARSLPETSVTAQGAGLLDLGAASAAEVTVNPVTLAFGRAEGDGNQPPDGEYQQRPVA